MNNETPNVHKKITARKVIMIALCAEAFVSSVILAAAGKLIVAPFAEYMAFSYTYGADGAWALFALFAALTVVSVALCLASSNDRLSTKLFVTIPATLLAAADLVIHSYAFLAGRGYGWNYLASAALDVAVIVCVVHPVISRNRSRHDGAKEE